MKMNFRKVHWHQSQRTLPGIVISNSLSIAKCFKNRIGLQQNGGEKLFFRLEYDRCKEIKVEKVALISGEKL